MFTDRSGQPLTFSEAFKKIANRIPNIWLDFELYLLYLAGLVPSHLFRNFIYQTAGIRMKSGSTIHMWARFFEIGRAHV